MSSKYIIKNCPAYLGADCTGFGNGGCKDCTDCSLKRIVELCKKELNSLETYVDIRNLECVTLQNVLKLLDIQEVE